MFLNFPITALCTELSVLLVNSKMYFDISIVAEKLKCPIVLIPTYTCMHGTSPNPSSGQTLKKKIKVKANSTLIFQYEQQNIQNRDVFDKRKIAELCHVVNFECTEWQ